MVALTMNVVKDWRVGYLAFYDSLVDNLTFWNNSIQKQHGVVTNKGGVVKIKAIDGKILVNGAKITKETDLHHNDR